MLAQRLTERNRKENGKKGSEEATIGLGSSLRKTIHLLITRIRCNYEEVSNQVN